MTHNATNLARRTLRRGTAAQGAEEAGRCLRDSAARPTRCAQGWRDAGSVRHTATRRRAGSLCIVDGRAAQAADKAVSQKLMPVAVGLDADGQCHAGAAQEAGSARRRRLRPCPSSSARTDGKAEALFFETHRRRARRWPKACRRRSTKRIAKLPIPKVMSYQLEPIGWTSVQFVRPAHGLVALHGADVVPVEALGLSRARHARPSLRGDASTRSRCATPTATPRSCATKAPSSPSFDARRAEIARQLAKRPRQVGGGTQPIARRRAARRSHGAGRAAERAGLRVRARVPRRAAGMPHPHDEGQPEVLPAARRRPAS